MNHNIKVFIKNDVPKIISLSESDFPWHNFPSKLIRYIFMVFGLDHYEDSVMNFNIEPIFTDVDIDIDLDFD